MTKARPILFSAPMIRALLDGRKTQTRRTINNQLLRIKHGEDWINKGPYGRPGDTLWVRESFVQGFECDDSGFQVTEDEDGNDLPLKVWYRADENNHFMWADDDGHLQDRIPWKPSIHMPRVASRLTLEITDVRVERLQDISEGDAVAEGVKDTRVHKRQIPTYQGTPSSPERIGSVNAYRDLWKSINGPGSWTSNPWIWALTFRVHKCNVDALLSQKAA